MILVPPSGAWVTISQPELEARYDELWAVSDIHGHRAEIEQLLVSAGLASAGAEGELHWDARARRQLLLVLGDLIDGGPDSAGVVRLMERLASEAPRAGSRVLVLLGNHEAQSLARGHSAHGKRSMREAPIAAFVGRWLFAHAGYIDAEPGEASLMAWLDQVARRWAAGGRERYEQFLTGRSIVDAHGWWKSRRMRDAMRRNLHLFGLDTVVFGHDPSALGAQATIAIDADAFLLKLDTGLKEKRSAGMMLRCNVADAVLRGLSVCRAALPDGTLIEVPIRFRHH